jgi:hypothetical protein
VLVSSSPGGGNVKKTFFILCLLASSSAFGQLNLATAWRWHCHGLGDPEFTHADIYLIENKFIATLYQEFEENQAFDVIEVRPQDQGSGWATFTQVEGARPNISFVKNPSRKSKNIKIKLNRALSREGSMTGTGPMGDPVVNEDGVSCHRPRPQIKDN